MGGHEYGRVSCGIEGWDEKPSNNYHRDIPSILSWYISPYFSANNANERRGTSLSIAVTFPRKGMVGGCGMDVVIKRDALILPDFGGSWSRLIHSRILGNWLHVTGAIGELNRSSRYPEWTYLPSTEWTPLIWWEWLCTSTYAGANMSGLSWIGIWKFKGQVNLMRDLRVVVIIYFKRCRQQSSNLAK